MICNILNFFYKNRLNECTRTALFYRNMFCYSLCYLRYHLKVVFNRNKSWFFKLLFTIKFVTVKIIVEIESTLWAGNICINQQIRSRSLTAAWNRFARTWPRKYNKFEPIFSISIISLWCYYYVYMIPFQHLSVLHKMVRL